MKEQLDRIADALEVIVVILLCGVVFHSCYLFHEMISGR